MSLTKPLAMLAIGGLNAGEDLFNGSMTMRPELREKPIPMLLIGHIGRFCIVENFV